MTILNRFSANLLYCDSNRFFAFCCGISGDSRPAILGIMRFAVRDSVPLKCRPCIFLVVENMTQDTFDHDEQQKTAISGHSMF